MRLDTIIIIGLMLVLLVAMIMSTFGWLETRQEIAKLQARGLEACYAVECDYNLIGKVQCSVARVPEMNITGFGLGNESYRYFET